MSNEDLCASRVRRLDERVDALSAELEDLRAKSEDRTGQLKTLRKPVARIQPMKETYEPPDTHGVAQLASLGIDCAEQTALNERALREKLSVLRGRRGELEVWMQKDVAGKGGGQRTRGGKGGRVRVVRSAKYMPLALYAQVKEKVDAKVRERDALIDVAVRVRRRVARMRVCNLLFSAMTIFIGLRK